MEANKRQITDIFNRHRILEIPFFQRSYVWSDEQWERFLDDMERISNGTDPYFFGSLIFKQCLIPADEGIGDKRTVIDGQQRLTTLIIFFKVLALLTGDKEIFDTFKVKDRPVALLHNHNDTNSFEQIVKIDKDKLDDSSDENSSSNKIIKAYDFFKKNVDVTKINSDAIIRHAIFIVIDLSNEENEQQIFDTLNSLGVRLTTAELLKNYLFKREDIDLYTKNWRDVFEKDEDTNAYWDREVYAGRQWRVFTDLFFYAYLQVKVHEKGEKVESKDREEFSRWENLFSSYTKFIEKYEINTHDFSKEIKKYAANFRKHFDSEVVNEGLRAELGMQRINAIIFGLDVTTLIPYILFIVSELNDTEQRQELFGCIESFVLRRLVMRSNNRGYSQLFLSMITERALTKNEFYALVKKREGTINEMPSDSDLNAGFHNSTLINQSAKGVLYFIESRTRSDKHSNTLQGINNYSLEHLMPKKWQNHWGALDEQKAATRSRKLLTLGNLAIITQKLNASIRDSAWRTKKEGNDRFGGLSHYASGIDVHKSFLEVDQWDESTIESRADDLFEKAKNIWAVE